MSEPGLLRVVPMPDSARTLDDSAVEPHIISKWIGLSRSASWLWVTGAFRFLGEDFQTVTGRVALAVLPEFLFDNIVSPVWLVGRDDPSGNRLRHQICELQARGIVLLVHEANIEVWHFTGLVASVADTTEFQLKLRVLFSTPALDQHMSGFISLSE